MNTKPLRIAHIDTERTWRGGQQQVWSLAEGLASRGHQNFWVVRKKSSLEEKLSSKKDAVLAVMPLGEWDVWAATSIRRWLQANDIDVLHAHSGHAAALGALAVRNTDIPFVITRRVDFHLSGNIFSKWKFGQASRIVAISRAIKEIIHSDGIPLEKIDVVYSGVDFSRFENIHPKSKEEMGFKSDDVVIGQIAALAPHKDQGTFVRAMALLIKKIPNAKGIIVGEGKERAFLESLIESEGMAADIRLEGFHQDPLNWLSAFDVFCLSSKEEGLGTSVIDAMALGIPVVATNAGGIPELIRNEQCGRLVQIENPVALAEAIAKAIFEKSKTAEYAASAKIRANDFNVKKTIDGMIKIYEELRLSRVST